MAIAPIRPYPMPTDLPSSRLPWSPDARRSALLIHDMQGYFLEPFPAGTSPVQELITNTARLREHCARLDIPVIYTAQPGGQSPEQRGLLKDLWGAGLSADPAHTAITAALTPAEEDIVVTKHRYSAFQRTSLAAILTEYGTDQLIICGIYAHIGVLMTASEAFQRDIETFLVTDAVADFSEDDHRMAVGYAANRCAVTLTTTQLIDALDASQRPRLAAAG
ncbi:isochorismatase family protein (plasmid) [Streptosporangium sp. CA-135522]|uniref:isochorismatase family protein n=1 Tax=Streptosporangium sp. CA-135522 TaxID=3240072 RepID=UPI003D918C65